LCGLVEGGDRTSAHRPRFPKFKRKATARQSFRLRNKGSGTAAAIRIGEQEQARVVRLPKLGLAAAFRASRLFGAASFLFGAASFLFGAASFLFSAASFLFGAASFLFGAGLRLGERSVEPRDQV